MTPDDNHGTTSQQLRMDGAVPLETNRDASERPEKASALFARLFWASLMIIFGSIAYLDYQREAQWQAERSRCMARIASHTKDSLYLVIDLSEGTNATSYPVRTLSSAPVEGWAEEYKTDKLVLRRIESGVFMMGSPDDELGRYDDEDLHHVTLTKPYYIGVFEVTQKQWKLVMGCSPSTRKGDIRPVGSVSYNDIRGTSKGAQWPIHAEVDRMSFMGRLRAKTSLAFDLPTEAQWEYACRAGTTTALNSGRDLTDPYVCPNMDEVGHYQSNDSYTFNSGPIEVGSYFPNDWGLYDMHGNGKEWCLDWYAESLGTVAVVDPVGTSSGSRRLARGGENDNAHLCRSAFRFNYLPSFSGSGFRLAVPVGRQ